MIVKKKNRGFTLIEMMVASAIFALMVVAIFQVMTTAQSSMKFNVARDQVESNASTVFATMGKDIRESSYAYIFAGDWRATNSAGVVSIDVARNYFSSTPSVGGTALAPGIASEGWAQCMNPVCIWSWVTDTSGTTPIEPNAFLASPIRNNPMSGSPGFPPTLAQSASDRRGRLFGHLSPGDTCPFCLQATQNWAKYGGMALFSPRRRDHSFSYGGASGYEAQWESIVFYSPFIDPSTGRFGMARYAFFADDVVAGASLIDLLDFDANGVIESPPMTDTTGNFLLDADMEEFNLFNNGTGLVLRYRRTSATGSFDIQVDRVTGQATVTVTGTNNVTATVQTEMRRFGTGISDLDISTYLNNPDWDSGGASANPTGVRELGVVRVTLQADRPGQTRRGPRIMDREETVQTTMFRPRN